MPAESNIGSCDKRTNRDLAEVRLYVEALIHVYHELQVEG